MGMKSKRKEWRIIPSLPWYEISEDGDIRRFIAARTRKAGHLIKGCTNSQGYRVVKLMVGVRQKKLLKVHRLVAEAFHGLCPPGYQAAHFDGVRDNNHFSNLRWATPLENQRDRQKHGTHNKGKRNGRALLTIQQVRQIRKEYTGAYGQAAAMARKYGLSNGAMQGIIQRRNWTWV